MNKKRSIEMSTNNRKILIRRKELGKGEGKSPKKDMGLLKFSVNLSVHLGANHVQITTNLFWESNEERLI